MRTRALSLFPAVSILFASSTLHAVPVHQWSKRFGDTSYQVCRSVAADASGNVVVAGRFANRVDFGGGPLPNGGIFVAKFDANGNHVWSKGIGDNGSIAVAVDGPGNVVLTGYFEGTVNFGGGPLTSAGPNDIFVAKLDSNGNHLWSQRFGDGFGQYGQSVATDASGNVVVTGYFAGTVDFGGGPLTSAGVDIFVAKFDASGNHIWSQRFGDGAYQAGNSVAADGLGDVIVCGEMSGTVDFGGGPLTSDEDIFVATFDADGNHIWSRRFGDVSCCQVGSSVAADGVGDVVVTGNFAGTVDFGGGSLTSAGGSDIFVAKLDAGGSHMWSKRFGAGAGVSVATDGLGDVVIAGEFGGTVDFGGGPLTSAGISDIFVAKFEEQPVPVLITSFEATSRQGAVEITWDVWSDEALESFALYRSDEVRAQPIVIAAGPFNHLTPAHVDTSVEPGKTYHYELLIHTQDGDDIRSQVATVTVPRFESTLGQNFPNPFKPTTTIEYTLSEQSSAVLGIYDAAGRLVARLDQGVRDAGTYRAEWNGRDAAGRTVGSGVYFYRLEGAPSVAPKKMVLLK